MLLAECNPTNRLVTTRMLRAMGHAVEAVADGVAAVKWLRTAPCDLALMDMTMLVMTGIAATELIRAEALPLGDLPIIGLTDFSDSYQERACLAAGMNGFITKPATTRRLTAAIETLRLSGRPSPPTLEVESQPPLLDERCLRQFAQKAGADGAVDAMEMFLDDVPGRMAEMRHALDVGAIDRLWRAVRALAGAARDVGLARLSQDAYRLQEALVSIADTHPARAEQLFQLLADSVACADEWRARQRTP